MISARHRTLLLALTLFFLLFALVTWVGLDVQQELEFTRGESFLGSHVAFFFLINVNIVFVLLLASLVVKNIVKLVLDRRRRLLGSHLRSRLVIAFIGLSLVPTVLLFLVSQGILGSVMQSWFSPRVVDAVDGAVRIARFHYESLESGVRDRAHFVATRVALQPTTLRPEGQKELTSLLEEKRAEYGLQQLILLKEGGEVLVQVGAADLPQPDRTVLQSISRGEVPSVVRPERVAEREVLRAYIGVPNAREFIVVASMVIPDALGEQLSGVLDAFDDYKELRSFRRPLTSSYLLTLVIVTLLVVFAAIWVGFYLSKTLTEPIRLLAGGTAEVARGNLSHRIPDSGDDEFSILVRSFNTMTQDLAQTTGELIARRRYMETVLDSVKVGVVSVDTESRITTLNPAALEMLGLVQPMVGQPLMQAVPGELFVKIQEIRSELAASAERVSTGTLSLFVKGRTHHLHVALTKLVDDHHQELGVVILLDDLTELVGMQRMAAWREVAKRIAHEIKNPLTPIQLSAQRLQRRITTSSEDEQAFLTECTETIVNQVETLRTLVNEFSKFARLPKINRAPADLSALVSEIVGIFRAAHPEVNFVWMNGVTLSPMEFDREQIGRVLMNLLDNAVASLNEGGVTGGVIELALDQERGVARLVVADNGAGISDQEKPKVFEPYYSNKKGGTGLGLAIVSSIVADHQGSIRIEDREGGGVRFIVELPLGVQEVLKRV